ncbi:MAG: hypothetical protein H0W08_21670 [Acidobacteria bacterium]|nr:hypothetical protein [Acidobacteriota bacterium]
MGQTQPPSCVSLGSLEQNIVRVESDYFKYTDEPKKSWYSREHRAKRRIYAKGTSIAPPVSMDIRFISSLTADDENAFAPALLKAVATILDQFPIAYTVRIETTGAQVFQQTHHSFESPIASLPRVDTAKARVGSVV